MQRVRDVLDQAKQCTTSDELKACLQRLIAKRFDPKQDASHFLEEPSVLSERLVWTMLQRLGARLQPNLDVFMARVGTDIFSSVDLIARYEQPAVPPDQAAAIELIGIDVTMIRDPEDLKSKQDVHRAKNRGRVRLSDPVTHERPRTVYRVMQFDSINFSQVLTKWRARRGQSTSSPEFEGLTFSDRQSLAREIFQCLVNHRGEPVYTPEAVQQAYRSVYGQHDPEQFQFSLPHKL